MYNKYELCTIASCVRIALCVHVRMIDGDESYATHEGKSQKRCMRTMQMSNMHIILHNHNYAYMLIIWLHALSITRKHIFFHIIIIIHVYMCLLSHVKYM